MDAEALYDLEDEKIESALHDRPITSVRDVEALYGRLYTLGRGLTGRYGPFLSPDAASELVGKERLVVVHVDLTDGTATLPDDPVTISTYASELSQPNQAGMLPDIEHVAHAKFEAARGVDHSITHLSGQSNGPEKHADHAVERFTRWPGEDAVREEADEHEDGWLLEALERFGENEEAMDEVASTVANATEDGQFLHTVAVKLEEEAVESTDRFESDATWHLPGEIEVLQEAMVRRKTTKFRAKNRAKDASGAGVCYVGEPRGGGVRRRRRSTEVVSLQADGAIPTVRSGPVLADTGTRPGGGHRRTERDDVSRRLFRTRPRCVGVLLPVLRGGVGRERCLRPVRYTRRPDRRFNRSKRCGTPIRPDP
jgi:hypothetical protein